jgi:hypothetical protein
MLSSQRATGEVSVLVTLVQYRTFLSHMVVDFGPQKFRVPCPVMNQAVPLVTTLNRIGLVSRL